MVSVVVTSHKHHCWGILWWFKAFSDTFQYYEVYQPQPHCTTLEICCYTNFLGIASTFSIQSGGIMIYTTHKWSEAEWLWSGWSLVKVGWLLVRIEHLRAMHTEDPGSQDSSLLSFVRLVSDFVYAGRSNHLHTWTVGEMFRMNPLGLMHTEWFKKCQRCYQEKVTESAFSHVLERFEGNTSKKKKKTKPLHPEVEALRL